MFPSPGAATTAHILSFNSYICGEYFGATKLFWRCYGRRFQLIYVRGMFHVSNAACPSGLSFQLIYVRGMFRGLLMSYPVAFWRFNSYMCGECFMFSSSRRADLVRFNSYMHGECFLNRRISLTMEMRFNSYMRGECFRRQEKGETVMHGFQFIYARGMFLFIFDNSIVLNNVSTHICAENVLAFMRGFAILDGANPQEFDCSLRVRAVIYRMR